MGQNIFAGGEVMGGGIALLEEAPNKKHDLLSSFYGASTIAGILLAFTFVSFLTQLENLETHWRLLYLLGGLTALFGLLLPRKATAPRSPSSIKSVLKEEKRTILIVAVASGFSYATYLMIFIFFAGFAPLISHARAKDLSLLNSSLLLIDFLLLPLFGLLAKKISRYRLMYGATFLTFISAPLLFFSLPGASLSCVTIIASYFVLLGVAFSAPLHAWARSITTPSSRYLVLSLGYALGSQFIGAPAACISLWLFQKTGEAWIAALYWSGAALLTLLVSLLPFRKKAHIIDPIYE